MNTQFLANIRLAEASDISSIQALIDENRDSVLPRPDGELLSLLGCIWVAELVLPDGNKVVGCAILEIYSPRIAEVRTVAITAKFRGQGIGYSLVSACLKEAKARKIKEVFAVTSRLEFFEKVNFHTCLNQEKYAVFWNGVEPEE